MDTLCGLVTAKAATPTSCAASSLLPPTILQICRHFFTSIIQRHGVLPSGIQNIVGSPSKKDSDLLVKLRPKFSIKTKREADLKATEWLLKSHGSLHATQNKKHRAYATFIPGGAYTAPCYRTIKNHTAMLSTGGRQLSADSVRCLVADGIKPAGASGP